MKNYQQEQPNKEFLNESQQEFVNMVTERMLKEGPIPTLKGKQKAEFEKEFNRFKQIAGMVNWPAYEEIYKKIILWFMAWGADNLPNLGKPVDPDKMDIQQEMPDKETILRICKLHKAWSIMAPWENVEDFVTTNWNSENIV